MNDEQRTDPVDRLLDSIATEEVPCDLEQRLRVRMAAFRSGLTPGGAVRLARRASLRRTAWIAGLAAALAVIGLFPWLTSSPQDRAYAEAMRALAKVKSVHVSGWTTDTRGRFSADRSRRWPVEEWGWNSPDGSRFYRREGPDTVWDDGVRRYRHREDQDVLEVGESEARDLPSHFAAIADFLVREKRPAVRKTMLDERLLGGRAAWGMQVEAGSERREVWFDAQTKLPIQMSEFRQGDGQWLPVSERTLRYDEELPKEIAGYRPPAARNVRNLAGAGSSAGAWKLRVQELAARYRSRPLPERMEVIARTAPIPGAQGQVLPGTKGYHVWPVDEPLVNVVRFNEASRWLHGQFRVPAECRDYALHLDLVYQAKVSPLDRLRCVLESAGFDLAEEVEQRKVWIARYDGRKLKPWGEVKAPIRRDERGPLRAGMSSGDGVVTLQGLFVLFNLYQDTNLVGRGLMIVDETGLSPPTDHQLLDDPSLPGCSEQPCWIGEEAPAIAKAWFAEQFGITFTEETRPITMFVVKKRRQGSP